MINNDTAKSTYTVTEGVTEYPIGFQYTTNPDGTPNLYVWYGDNAELEYGTGYTLSDDGLSIVLLSPVEVDETLSVAVDEPFIQDSDYVIGRIDSEQIEKDFDKSVLRDLELRDYADDINGRLAEEEQARADADTELQDAIDDEVAARSLADTTLQNNIDAEADAREDADAGLQANIDTKVSKSGDTMTGALTLNTETTGSGDAVGIIIRPSMGGNDSRIENIISAFYSGGFNFSKGAQFYGNVRPALTNFYDLGGNAKWRTLFVTKINNGADIAVPVSGGTMARIEDMPTQASDVHALPDTTKYGASLALSIDPSTYVVTAQLKDQDNNNIGAAQTIDLPLESVVVSGAYDSATKEVVLTLEGGSTIRFSVADLVSGLQEEITAQNKLDADFVDDSASTNKFTNAIEKGVWNAKVDRAGDTMTGSLTFSSQNCKLVLTPYQTVNRGGACIRGVTAGTVGLDGFASDKLIDFAGLNNLAIREFAVMDIVNSFFCPVLNNVATLGHSQRAWANVYTTKINNGADIAIPTSGGTMARIEDLPSAEQGTTGYVYTKTASGAEWAAPSGGTTITIITED